MTDKILNFPAPRSEFDAINEARLTDEERAAIRAALATEYSRKRESEEAARQQPRAISAEAFADRV